MNDHHFTMPTAPFILQQKDVFPNNYYYHPPKKVAKRVLIFLSTFTSQRLYCSTENPGVEGSIMRLREHSTTTSVTSTEKSPSGPKGSDSCKSHSCWTGASRYILVSSYIFTKTVLQSQCEHTSFRTPWVGPNGLIFIMKSLEKETGTFLRSHLRKGITRGISLIPEVHRTVQWLAPLWLHTVELNQAFVAFSAPLLCNTCTWSLH